MGVNIWRRDFLIFSVSFQTLTDTSQEKKRRQKYRCAQSHSDAHACPPDYNAVDQTAEIPRTREFSAGTRRINTVTPQNGCSRRNCQPREAFVAPKPDLRTRLRPKTEKSRINAEFSRVGTFVRNTARDVLKSTVKIEIRYKKTWVHVLHAPELFLDHSERDVDVIIFSYA